MTAYWAGPSASHLLALLGAEVVHLESEKRPDGARAIGVSPEADLAGERGPIFAALNTNKKGLTIDFSRADGLDQLRRFIPTCDVVIENFTPRVLDQVALTYDAMRELREDLILVRMPGFGLDGPWRDNAAFAFVIEDASGLTWLTGHPDQNPVEPYCVGDSNAGLHAAYGLMLALAHRDSTGAGCQVEAAMIDAALSITAEQVIEHSAHGALLTRSGNRGPTAAPQNVYDCADLDEYGREPNRVAVAVATDDQWLALRSALGDPAWAADAALAGHDGRVADHHAIDKHLQAWCGVHTAAEVVDRLWEAGVPVARVLHPHHQPDLPPLQQRAFFEAVDHPVAGPARYSTLPFRFTGGPERFHTRHAPLLGEHTDELLGELEAR
jgi:crotonobetainyl-CoA:carnitine CoA-transferase CaiB-like acyl-CoA transferase